MSATDPAVQDMLRIQRIAHDFFEPPTVNKKPLGRDEMKRLSQFVITLADQMDDNQTRREKPLTRDELAKVLMACSKWALEDFTK